MIDIEFVDTRQPVILQKLVSDKAIVSVLLCICTNWRVELDLKFDQFPSSLLVVLFPSDQLDSIVPGKNGAHVGCTFRGTNLLASAASSNKDGQRGSRVNFIPT